MSARLDQARADIVQSASSCLDLQALSSRATQCVACAELASSRRSVVVGDFPAGAKLLIVGEAPGAQEDEHGRPFIGKGGQLLDRLLEEACIDRPGVAVANVLKCRPPANRTPTRAEANRCRGWLDRQVELLDPRLVVTLGGTALAWAFGTGHRLFDVRARVHEWNGRLLLASYHPSAALRFGPGGAPMAGLREDLLLAGDTLRALA